MAAQEVAGSGIIPGRNRTKQQTAGTEEDIIPWYAAGAAWRGDPTGMLFVWVVFPSWKVEYLS